MFRTAILSALGLGFLVYVRFILAIFARPAFVSVKVSLYASDSEASLA